jgi:hypothetical protein
MFDEGVYHPPLNMSQDWAGWVLMLFSFGIVLMWKSIRDDTKVVYAIWFCLCIHHVVALWNAYVGHVIGAEGDARTFQFYAAKSSALLTPEWVALGNPTLVYLNSLGIFYRAFGASFFSGGELSVLAFTLSCVVLVKLTELLDLRHFCVGAVLFFGLLPSAVIFRSVTLRESWQALFLLLTVYWIIRLRRRPGKLIFLFMLMSSFCMASLHGGLRGYAVYLILIGIYWGLLGRKKGTIRARFVRFLFIGLIAVGVIMLAQRMGWYVTPEQGLERVDGFRKEAVTVAFEGRATYGVALDTSSVLGIVTSTTVIFVQYMFAPFPWQIENVKDAYALLESMLRFVLLFSAVYSWRRFSGEVRSYYGFLIIIFLGLELMWALGTINWGTSTRHHVPGYSVIVLLGVPGLFLFMRNIHIVLFGRRKAIIFQDRGNFVKPDSETNEML